jgi:hypothetical protein
MPKGAADVLRYFLRNPYAADSLEGVVRWRLAEETIHRSVTETDEALRWLVAHGLLLQQLALGTEPIFSLNTGKLTAVKDLLANEPSKP